MKPDILISQEIELSYIRKMGNVQNGKTEEELIILLPVGCYWAKHNSGCSYCGYQHLVDELNRKYTHNLLEIVKKEISKSNTSITRVSFFVGGSFFEINKDTQDQIISYISKQENIKEIYIESRPELIKDNNIKRIKKNGEK